MPGAGHLIAANHMYKVAKPDGLTLGHFHGGWFLYQLFKRPGIEFDATKYEFLGSPIKESRACAFTKASGITSVERWLAAKTPVKIGGIGGGAPDDMARMLAATTALPIQLVSRLQRHSEIRLAAESGELAGGCWTWDSIRSTWSKAIQSGEAIVVLQAVSKPHPDLPNVPLAQSLAKTRKRASCFRPASKIPPTFIVPTSPRRARPKQRVEILRQAFDATMKDAEFLADAKKANLDIEPITGQEMAKLVAGIFKLDPTLATKLKSILNPS